MIAPMNRRTFLALAAAAWPGLALGAGRRHPPLGVELYTLRNQIKNNNLLSVLRQVHEIGYEEVETSGALHTIPAHELLTTIRRAGLTVSSGLFNYEDFPSKITYGRHLGLKWMGCTMLPKAQWGSPESFRRAAAVFNQWGKECKAQGMRFAFHNHNYEFQDLKGTTGFDILLKETDPELVWLELDTYWITQAGRDPVLLLSQLGKRVRLLHIKDRKAGQPTSQELNESAFHFTEVGSGTIPWKAIFAEAEKIGIEHYYVEQDQTEVPPIDSLKTSYQYLHRLLS